MIQTVNRQVNEQEIDKMLYHEHFAFGKMDYIKAEENNYDSESAYRKYIEMVSLMQKYQVNFVLDATPIEWGRDPVLLKRLSEETGINIVCATGFYKDEEASLEMLKSLSYIVCLERYLTELFVKEITAGIGETNCRAGVIKVASSYKQIKALERTVFIAAAKAQQLTGVPIITHCERGTMGLAQAELLLEAGVASDKIVIDHMTSNDSLEEQKEILRTGVFIGYDQFGIESIPGIPKDEEKINNLIALLNAGYENQIVISHDTLYERMGVVSKSKPRLPDMIFIKVIPALKQAGITELQINKLLRDNLRRLFRG